MSVEKTECCNMHTKEKEDNGECCQLEEKERAESLTYEQSFVAKTVSVKHKEQNE